VFNRLSVLDGLRSVKELLKACPKRLPNGVAMFVGGGMSELVFPPQPLKRPMYHCGKGFELEPLLAMLDDEQPTFAVVVIDGQSAVFATARGPEGEAVKVLKTVTTHNRGRCRRGGQSALRFDRIRDQVEAAFVREVAEVSNALFPSDEVAGVLLAGPANMKHLLAESSALAKPLQSKVVATVETSQGGRTAVSEALRRGAEALSAFLHAPEQSVLVEFFSKLQQDDTSRVVYGIKETLAALEAHAVKKLLVSRSMAEGTTYAPGEGTGSRAKGVAHRGAAEHEGSATCARTATLATHLQDSAAKCGAELVWINVKTEEGVRFTDGFGGLAAFCHWPFEYDDDEEEEEEQEEAEEKSGYAGGAASPPAQVDVQKPAGVSVPKATTLRADAPSWRPLGN